MQTHIRPTDESCLIQEQYKEMLWRTNSRPIQVDLDVLENQLIVHHPIWKASSAVCIARPDIFMILEQGVSQKSLYLDQ